MKRLAIALMVLMAACQPNYQDGKTKCSPDGKCPSGFICGNQPSGPDMCFRFVPSSKCTSPSQYRCRLEICAAGKNDCPLSSGGSTGSADGGTSTGGNTADGATGDSGLGGVGGTGDAGAPDVPLAPPDVPLGGTGGGGAGGSPDSGGAPAAGGTTGAGGVVTGGASASGNDTSTGGIGGTVVGTGGVGTSSGGASAMGGSGGSGGTGTAPSRIASFTAYPETIKVGQSSTLSWTVTGTSTTLRIDPDIASVWGRTSQVVTPDRTTAYTLTLNGSVTAQVTVNVQGGFAATSSMAVGRASHTATSLLNGNVLVVGGGTAGDDGSFTTASAELYNPNTGKFATTGPMSVARQYHTSTALPGGKVLVAGGGSTICSASAELYDPATGRFAPTGDMVVARLGHTAALLPSGKVLIAGGMDCNANNALGSAELYDPATGIFTATGNMTVERMNHTATSLPSGKVLISGGKAQAEAFLSAELYDPAAGTFTATGDMTAARASHAATLLASPSGQVLITGGFNGSGGSSWLASAELYDPAGGRFAAVGSMTTGRRTHTATLLGNGQVLIAGGIAGSNYFVASAELYDPAGGTFTPTGGMTEARIYHTANLLPGGKVLVAGGNNHSSAGFLASAETYELP